MRVRFMTFLTLAALLFSIAASAEYPAYTREFAVIDHTSSLNLREYPSYDARVLASYTKGEWVELQGDYGDWAMVRVLRTGRSGYMVSSYLTSPAQSGGAYMGVVSNQNARAFLNLREYPSYDARVLGIYYNGAVCRILSEESGWYQVEIDGMLGFFRHEFVQVSAGGGGTYATAVASSGKTVNFREGPSRTEKVLARVPLGQQVEVLLKGKQFWYVRYQGLSGFMAGEYLSEASGVSPVNPDPPSTGAYALIASPAGLNLREQPSSASRVLAACPNGSRVEILRPGLNWCKVRRSSGETGYMMTRYLTVYGVPGTPIRKVSNGGTYVNLRSSPRIQAGNVLAALQSGEEITVLIPGDEWTRVSWQGTEGYMMTCFLQ